jgi:hypothetical protein
MSVLTAGQREFRDRLASRTGLNAGVITAWLLAEESSGAAKSRQSQNQHNWLNIGWTDKGRLGFTYGREWNNPSSAADATAAFLKGQKYGASGGIRKIIRTAGKSPMDQMNAIAGAGWASSGYGGSNTLLGLYNQYGKGTAQPSSSVSSPTGGSSGGAQPMGYRPSLSNSLLKSEPYVKLIEAQAKLPAASSQKASKAPSSPVASNGSVNYGSGTPRLSHPSILSALSATSSLFGKPLTVGTTTNHSKYTVNGNVSDHYSGNAADVPATGQALIRMGQAALQALGMSPSEARRQTGGLFNLNKGGKRYQVIFNTQQGGDHTNHLHIGVR